MGSLFMRFPGGKSKVLTFSFDDGIDQDIKLIELFDKYDLKCTFNISSGLLVPEKISYPENQISERWICEEYAVGIYGSSVHEVALHGYTHPFLEQLPLIAAVDEVICDRKKLEKLFGKIIRGMAYPYGKYNDDVIQILKSCGILYSRTTKNTEAFDIPENPLVFHPTCKFNNPGLMALADKFINEEPLFSGPWIFCVWGHSFELDTGNNWHIIESFAQKMSGRDDAVWYATCNEIFEYIAAYKSLVFSSDMDMVYNPTSVKLYFEYFNKNYCVEPGKYTYIQKI